MKRIIFFAILSIIIFIGNLQAEEFGDLAIHGFVSQGFLKSSDNNFLAKTSEGTFEFNELGINFGAWLLSDLRVGTQFFARDLGEIGNDKIDLDWAYADYRFRKWLGLRAGKMKSPFGLYNETRDIDMLRVSILLPQGIYNEGWRDSLQANKGLGLYGIIPTGILGSFGYDLQLGAMDIPVKGGISGFINSQAALVVTGYPEIKDSYLASARWMTPLDGFRVGATSRWFGFTASALTANNKFWQDMSTDMFLSEVLQLSPEEFAGAFGTTFGSTLTYDTIDDFIAFYAANIDPATAQLLAGGALMTNLINIPLDLVVDNMYYVVSMEYIWDNLTIAAEYGINKFEYEMFIGGNPERGGEVELEGWYASAAYHFFDWFEAGLYYSYFCPDIKDREGEGMNTTHGYPKAIQYSKDWCLSLRFDVNDNWTIKLEGHMVDGLAVMYIEDQELNADGSYATEDKWNLFAFKMTYNF